MTLVSAEIVARIGGEQAALGIHLPLGDLMIGACALELGYVVATGNARDFERIPGLKLISLQERFAGEAGGWPGSVDCL